MSFTKKEIKLLNIDPYAYLETIDSHKLEKLLEVLSDKYYNDEAVVSDDTFDILKDGLKKMDPNNKFLKKVGAPVSGKKIALPYPMGSLNKLKPEDEKKIKNWIKKYEGPYVISDKLDGNSAQLYCNKNGEYELYTRGDGDEGKDISYKLKHIIRTPINLPPDTSIRGELVISKKNFETIKDKYANILSAVTGIINKDDIAAALLHKVDFVAYNILHPSDVTYIEKLNLLKKWGFDVVNYELINNCDSSNGDSSNEDSENIPTLLEQLEDKYKDRSKNGIYKIDGIVCADSSVPYKHEEGYPKQAFAFKMQTDEQTMTTKVISVTWKPSMHSFLYPVVNIEPVTIKGSVIKNATGHNAKFIYDNKIGKGAIIEIIKSGDVIPKITKVIQPAAKGDFPEKFVWEGIHIKPLEKNEYNSDSDENEEQDEIEIKRNTHFFKTLNIQFLSDGLIKKLYDNDYTTIFDILSAEQADLQKIDGLGKKIVTKIFNEINKKIETCKLYELMAASLKFPKGLGRRKLKLITDVYPDILSFKYTAQKLYDIIIEIKGFGDISAKDFANYFNDFIEFYNELSDIVDLSHLEEVETDDSSEDEDKHELSGGTVVFTGFRDKVLEEKIIKLGAKVTTTISKNTDILVCADKNEDSTKMKKANELNIEILEKNEFIEMYDLD